MSTSNLPARFIPALLATLLAVASSASSAQDVQVIPAKAGPAPAVILISGVSGTALYQDYGQAVSGLGYAAVLVSGKDISNQHGTSAENFKRVLAALRTDSRVKPGKVSVIGFSLGGGGALLHAASQPDAVASVAAYYPAVTRLPGIKETASKVAVPTLILAGAKDRFNDCCLIESIREFEAAALAAGTQVSVVAYPDAEHGFNLKVPAHRATDAADAWARVQDLLAKTLPK
jgi:dienelactone hydrolase